MSEPTTPRDPRDPEYVPTEVTMPFEDWIAATAALGLEGWQQLGYWRLVNPRVTVDAVARARCAAGFHDDHEPGDSQWCEPE
jgi:hypothetical protein